MTRSLSWTITAVVALVVAPLLVFALYEEARRTLVALIAAGGGLPAVAYLYVMMQRLDAAEKDGQSQERVIADATRSIDEVRSSVEKQIGAIEETAASLHQMTASLKQIAHS